MPNKMLIDASHPEETRVVVVRGNRIEEFDFESQDKKQLKGNIYLARVTRVEPSLQAAFVEYGGNRHGFLAFSEIHPDYYQIPVADRQALLKAEADAARAEEDDEDEENGERGRGRRRRRTGRGGRPRGDEKNASAKSEDEAGEIDDHASEDDANGDADHDGDGASAVMAHDAAGESVSEAAPAPSEDDDHSNGHGDEGEIDTVGAEDAIEEARTRRKPVRRQYKIQEVIKRRQILLVQVVKEERGNKGAALTTYLSLAGRYSVLMPNTARGGGISRKITNATDRKRLKDVVKDLEVPQGMGVILRTAGESRTKAEIKRDYEYLMRLWENVRSLTLQSTAPALVYEEGSLIKRSVRDLYNKDIDDIQVAGDEGYREAKDFMRMLMPSHAKVVQPYRDNVPLFVKHGVEAQLDKMLQPQVTLKSGGYIIINQTEALVAIDVNSGRSTKEHSIEDTALQTNLEAAEEVARQLRLRDMAGLIVIDFIDMEENRNNRAVEKRLKDHLKNDRARIQVGRISHFGLLEMSRQRIRASVLESTMQPCPHCGGTGHVRSESSVALLVIRAVEEYLLKENRYHVTVRTPPSTALYVLNHKRRNLAEMEARFGLTITIDPDEDVGSQHYAIVRGAIAEKSETFEPPMVIEPPALEPEDDVVEETEVEHDEAPATAQARTESGDTDEPRRKRRRRRRRGGRDRDNAAPANGEQAYVAEAAADLDDDDADADTDAEPVAGDALAEDRADDGSGRRRRRGKRGGRRNRRDDSDAALEFEAQNDVESAAAPTADATASSDDDRADMTPPAATEDTTDAIEADVATPEVDEAKVEKKKPSRRKSKTAEEPSADAPAAVEEKKPAKPRTRRKKAAADEDVAAAEAVEAAPDQVSREEAAPEATPEPTPSAKPEKVAEPVATPSAATPAEEDDKPRKTGWWQRKTFF